MQEPRAEKQERRTEKQEPRAEKQEPLTENQEPRDEIREYRKQAGGGLAGRRSRRTRPMAVAPLQRDAAWRYSVTSVQPLWPMAV